MVIFKFISFLFYRAWAWLMIREAKRRSLETGGRRFWVLRLQGRLYVFNKDQIKWYKQNGTFKDDLNFLGLDKVAIFDTHSYVRKSTRSIGR